MLGEGSSLTLQSKVLELVRLVATAESQATWRPRNFLSFPFDFFCLFRLTLYLVKPRILGMAKYSYKKIHRKSIVRFFAKVNMLKHAQMSALSRELKTDGF